MEPPPSKTLLEDETGKAVGEVRSSTLSPRLGGIALAMVRREIEPGSAVVARWESGHARAEVRRLALPL